MKLPQWKDENPNTYRKMQISTQIRRLKKLLIQDPESESEIKGKIRVLEDEYKTLGTDRRKQEDAE